MSRITATEANRNFSSLLARVRAGEAAEITVRGEVVAELRPVSKKSRRQDAEKQKNWDAFMERLRKRPPLGVLRGTRDELYDRD
jgi:prevent-host-death family protein